MKRHQINRDVQEIDNQTATLSNKKTSGRIFCLNRKIEKIKAAKDMLIPSTYVNGISLSLELFLNLIQNCKEGLYAKIRKMNVIRKNGIIEGGVLKTSIVLIKDRSKRKGINQNAKAGPVTTHVTNAFQFLSK